APRRDRRARQEPGLPGHAGARGGRPRRARRPHPRVPAGHRGVRPGRQGRPQPPAAHGAPAHAGARPAARRDRAPVRARRRRGADRRLGPRPVALVPGDRVGGPGRAGPLHLRRPGPADGRRAAVHRAALRRRRLQRRARQPDHRPRQPVERDLRRPAPGVRAGRRGLRTGPHRGVRAGARPPRPHRRGRQRQRQQGAVARPPAGDGRGDRARRPAAVGGAGHAARRRPPRHRPHLTARPRTAAAARGAGCRTVRPPTRPEEQPMTTAERRTDDPAAVLDSVPLGAFVGGTWTDTGRTFPVEDPATGEVLAAVADCGPDEARAALDAAAAAQPALAATAPRERAELLRRIHELLLRDRERLATIITLEMGKPVAESRGEVAYAAEFFRWLSEEACRNEGSYATSPDGRGRILVTRRPVGPCLLITPWNFPLAMGARKIAPALAAGCTSVVKPAEQTPLTMLALAALLEEAGVPAGAVSVLPASDPEAVADPVLADPRLRKLSFTGSTEVGRHLIRRSADQVLRVSLELGGNAPFLVFEDADLDAAVEGALVAKMRNGGEACTAANRFLVHDAVADEFARRLAERMAALVVGRGTEPGVDVGPLIDGPARDRVVGLIEEATAGGAQVRTGGA